jgi:hypothetical protein
LALSCREAAPRRGRLKEQKVEPGGFAHEGDRHLIGNPVAQKMAANRR